MRVGGLSIESEEVEEGVGFGVNRVELSTTNQTTITNVQVRREEIPHLHPSTSEFRLLLHVATRQQQQSLLIVHNRPKHLTLLW